MSDTYANFSALACSEASDAWNVLTVDRPGSGVLIIAPHGGGIEPGTSELARMIAGEDYSLYCFEGLKERGNRDLHITSHNFDEPRALELAARSSFVVAIHGCLGTDAIYLGGRDSALIDLLTHSLQRARLPVFASDHRYPARHPNNICNRGTRGIGAQLEITRDLRCQQTIPSVAEAVRSAIAVAWAIGCGG
jgi:phage replication-related protein YjqB (UPF0714/DUF867 family)